MGLDLPVTTRYVHWLGRFVQGDLGISTNYQAPVASLLGRRVLNSAISGRRRLRADHAARAPARHHFGDAGGRPAGPAHLGRQPRQHVGPDLRERRVPDPDLHHLLARLAAGLERAGPGDVGVRVAHQARHASADADARGRRLRGADDPRQHGRGHEQRIRADGDPEGPAALAGSSFRHALRNASPGADHRHQCSTSTG